MTDNILKGRKRPGWVWAISIFFLFSSGYTLLSFYLVKTGFITLDAAQEAYFNNLTAIDYVLSILVGFVNILGAVLLFYLRKFAFYFFVTALSANFLFTGWHIVSKGWLIAIGGPGFVGVLIGWALLIGVCVYSWKLIQRGILT